MRPTQWTNLTEIIKNLKHTRNLDLDEEKKSFSLSLSTDSVTLGKGGLTFQFWYWKWKCTFCDPAKLSETTLKKNIRDANNQMKLFYLTTVVMERSEWVTSKWFELPHTAVIKGLFKNSIF